MRIKRLRGIGLFNFADEEDGEERGRWQNLRFRNERLFRELRSEDAALTPPSVRRVTTAYRR